MPFHFTAERCYARYRVSDMARNWDDKVRPDPAPMSYRVMCTLRVVYKQVRHTTQ